MTHLILATILASLDVWVEPVLLYPPTSERSELSQDSLDVDTLRGEHAHGLLVLNAEKPLEQVRLEIETPHESLAAPSIHFVGPSGFFEPALPVDLKEGAMLPLWIQFHATVDAQPGLHESEIVIRADNRRRSTRVPLSWRVRKRALDMARLPSIQVAVDSIQFEVDTKLTATLSAYPFTFWPSQGRYAAPPEQYELFRNTRPGSQGAADVIVGPIMAGSEIRGLLQRQAFDTSAAWSDYLEGAYWKGRAAILVDMDALEPREVLEHLSRIESIDRAYPLPFGRLSPGLPSGLMRAVPWDTRTMVPGGATILESTPPCGELAPTAETVTGSAGAAIAHHSGVMESAVSAADCCLSTAWAPGEGGAPWLAIQFDSPQRLERLRIVGGFGESFTPTVLTAYPGQPFTPSTVDWTRVQPGVLDGVLKHPSTFAALRLDCDVPPGEEIWITEVLWRECDAMHSDDSGGPVWLMPPGGPFGWEGPPGYSLMLAAALATASAHIAGLLVPMSSSEGDLALAGYLDDTLRPTPRMELLRDAVESVAMAAQSRSASADYSAQLHRLALALSKQSTLNPEWIEQFSEWDRKVHLAGE